MRKTISKGLLARISILVALVVATVTVLTCIALPSTADSSTIERSAMVDNLMETATQYVVVYHKQLGGSHYAYTEGLQEEYNDGNTSAEGNEANFNGGSKMTLVTLSYDGDKVVKTETQLLKSSRGVIRDPDVSADGTKIVFSMKNDGTDDYHLYIYDLTTNEYKQITFGTGAADIEPVFNADGTIVFCSTRDIQTVDCWKTPVSNLYKCDADGSNITRLGYDQVHTTYPTTAEDGRIIYTRWDYNDRNQMYVQAVFQMFADGTNQTELFGNNLNNPTTLIHTREIPGASGKYISVACGHHQYQCGKLAIIDTNQGRNTTAAVDYVWDDQYTKQLERAYDNDTTYYQQGRVYKYPYAINENEFLVSTAESYTGVDTAFDIMLINTKGDSVVIAEGSSNFPASQIVPIKTTNLFNRASLVNYTKDAGTYYVADVYAGQTGIPAGEVKYLRVVALEYRASAIGATVGRGSGSSDPFSPVSTGNGAWDIKKVVGVATVFEDGSALFTAPSNVPLYFQLLDENGYVIQTMRSWSTLMPGEYFSCVGCHLDKNYTPIAQSTTTLAMKNGVETLQPDLWMSEFEEYEDYDPYGDLIGFDYLTTIQPIFDESCITCHSNKEGAYTAINANILKCDDLTSGTYIIDTRDQWYYTTSNPASDWKTADVSGEWALDAAPFGTIGTQPGAVNTVWDSSTLYLRKTVTVTSSDLSTHVIKLYGAYTGSVELYVNGTLVYSGSETMSDYETITLTSKQLEAFVLGTNEIAVKVTSKNGGQYFDTALVATVEGGSSQTTFFDTGSEWVYTTSASADYSTDTAGDWTKVGFNASSWTSGKTPYGNRIGNQTTNWAKSGNNYLWARKTVVINDLNDLGSKFAVYMNVYFDDTFYVYINGNLVYSNSGWNDGYETIELANANKYFVKGENVIAVSLTQHDGGYEFDMSMYAVKSQSDIKMSLQSTGILSDRMKKYFPLSYLVLTGTTAEQNVSVYQFVGSSTNKYTNWVSSMSQCEMLKPYAYGSHKSNIIKKISDGHGDLTDAQIRAIACWIDLGVPCYGSYYVRDAWGANDIREYEEEQNKREFYDMLNDCALIARAGTTPAGQITIAYTPTTGSELTATGEGLVTLYTTKKYSKYDVITVTLPEGEHYLALSLTSRVGESIIYCPNSTFSITLPDLTTRYPNTMNPNFGVSYKENTITARLATAEELTAVHNLAQNSYDIVAGTGSYPHASTNGYKDNAEFYSAPCVIDGFTVNLGSGSYPYQSWQPATVNDDTTLTIDFGHEVNATQLVVVIRAASKDSYFTNCTVTFSDGTSMVVQLTNSTSEQYIDIGNVVTSSVTFSDFVVETSVNGGSNVAISEVKVMGTEILG